MKPLAGSRSRLVQVAKAAVLKNPRKYKNVGGVGSSPSSPSSPRSGNSPSSPRSGSSPKSGNSPRSPIISISKEDKNILIDILYHIVALIKKYKALSEVSVEKYSFNVLDPSKTDFLVFTRNTTKNISDVIDKIFVEVKKLRFISIDTSSYKNFMSKYDVQINNINERITRMTTNDFIKEATYTRFFVDLRYALLTFFNYIQKNIKINGDISDKGIIDIVNNKILYFANWGYAWFSDEKNKEFGTNNIKLFMKKIKEQQDDREHAEFLELMKIEREHEAIRRFHACGTNRGRC